MRGFRLPKLVLFYLLSLTLPVADLGCSKESEWRKFTIQAEMEIRNEHYDQASKILDRAIEATHDSGENKALLADALHKLAAHYHDRKNWPAAQKYYLLEKAYLSPGDLDERFKLADIQHHLGDCYYNQDKFAEATPCYLNALEFYKENQVEPSRNQAILLRNAGKSYGKQDDATSAIDYLEQALQMMDRKLMLPKDDIDRLNALKWLANNYFADSKYERAVEIIQEPLSILEKEYERLGNSMSEFRRSELSSILRDYGRFAGSTGDLEKAEELTGRARTMAMESK